MHIVSKTLFSSAIYLLCLASCGDSEASTTAVITTIITSNGSATDGQDDTTGEPDTTTSPTTGPDEVTSTSTTGDETSSTGEPPQGCFNPGTECPPAPGEATFCEYVAAACEAHGIEPFYCAIVNEKCSGSRTVDECQVCFSLENYCAQIGSDCAGLMTECLCAHESIESRNILPPAAGDNGGPCVGPDRLCFDLDDTCYVSLQLGVDAHICGNVDGLDLTECTDVQDCMPGQGCAPEFSACVWLVP